MKTIDGLACISIIHEEFDQSSYQGVRLWIRTNQGDTTDIFNSGDPEIDFRAAITKAQVDAKDHIMIASSCDDFVTDGKGYRWAEDANLGKVIVKR